MTELRVIICFLAEFIMACASINYSPQCRQIQDAVTVKVIQEEGLRLPCPNSGCEQVINDSLIFWFKNESDEIQPISMEETKRVHYHGGMLYFLPLSLNDSGIYITQWWRNAHKCYEFVTEIVVYENIYLSQVYTTFFEQQNILSFDCPVWQDKGENISWYKQSRERTILVSLKGQHPTLKIYQTKETKGIYTCICTWEHHGQLYNTSGSHEVLEKDDAVAFPPTFQHPINNSVEFVNLGEEVKLNCLVFFGNKVNSNRIVRWERNSSKLDCDTRIENGSWLSSFTISQVSETDLQYPYCCVARSLTKMEFVCITLKTRESLLPITVTFSCMVLFLLLAAGMVKWFTVDLVLFFRSFRIMQRKRDDGKVYDAYVIYQKDNVDEITGSKADYFVNKILPAVLEKDCGFKLYIEGRDDLPGEDCTAFIEPRMQLSRRLIAVLPGSSHHQGATASLCYDWHVGLHRVLVEQELRVILIQLDDMKEYSHLPLGLQHLLQKTPPLRWDERNSRATCPSSCFWKQVRYMMPVPSVSSSRDVDI
ncbi:interleukin-1 receptor type 1 [Tachysurus vachellii]|uniref:interleukin-1 receptor type 1 n=1 Tax=Tachysurus vachellii TaxID=175792 RepID=UPI00296AE905|nr:interleukin-1 receptor type 1 [Tachysurus vachellii]XP_060731790.1 interleukin-1 receptor type 1 [Tachysurus vachellii]